ncbi:MAG: AI-2E family transporter [Candidatus Paceibacterota bacterium]
MRYENTPISITITSGTIIKVLLLLVTVYLLFVLKDIVMVILTSVVIASAVEPWTLWFEKRGMRRLPAVMVIYGTVALSAIAFFYLFLPPLLDETAGLLRTLPAYLESTELWDPGNTDNALINISNTFEELGDSFSTRDLLGSVQSSISNISAGFIRTASVFFGGLLSFVIIVVLSFYLAVQKGGVESFLRIVTPIKNETYIIGLWQRSQMKIGQWMQGQLLLGVIVGVLVYLGLSILGVPYAFLLALLAAVLELVPLFGPIIAAIPAVGIAFGDGGVTAVLLVVGLYVIIQQFENHLIYPLVVRKVVGVPPLLVILALLVGAKLAGFLGVLLAVPIAAALREYLFDVEVNRKKAEEVLADDAQHEVR